KHRCFLYGLSTAFLWVGLTVSLFCCITDIPLMLQLWKLHSRSSDVTSSRNGTDVMCRCPTLTTIDVPPPIYTTITSNYPTSRDSTRTLETSLPHCNRVDRSTLCELHRTYLDPLSQPLPPPYSP
ncbi:hypothetical protein NECAME_07689, partial [Necator americanus]